jgi:hypothetical protein
MTAKLEGGSASRPDGPAAAGSHLEDGLRQQLLAEIPAHPRARRELAGMDTHGLLVVYFTWLSRLVSSQPRRVHLSSEFQESGALNGARATQVSKLLTEIERGEDLTPRLSRRIATGYVESTRRKRTGGGGADLDDLLNAWGVHHLHLPDPLHPRRFSDHRLDDLLFVSFTDRDAYVTDVMRHGDWSRRHVLEVLARNWPDHGVIHQAVGAVGLSRHFGEDDAKRLRDHNVNLALMVDGRVFLPRGGLTLNHRPMEAVRDANRLVHTLMRVRGALAEDEEFLTHHLRNERATPQTPEWRLEVVGSDLRAVDDVSGTALSLA